MSGREALSRPTHISVGQLRHMAAQIAPTPVPMSRKTAFGAASCSRNSAGAGLPVRASLRCSHRTPAPARAGSPHPAPPKPRRPLDRRGPASVRAPLAGPARTSAPHRPPEAPGGLPRRPSERPRFEDRVVGHRRRGTSHVPRRPTPKPGPPAPKCGRQGRLSSRLFAPRDLAPSVVSTSMVGTGCRALGGGQWTSSRRNAGRARLHMTMPNPTSAAASGQLRPRPS